MDDNQQPSREPGSQAEREAASIIEACLLAAPQGEAQEEAEATKRQEEENVFLLTDRAALSLDCIALVRSGEIVPLYDMSDLPKPMTVKEKMKFAVAAAQVLLDGVMAVMEEGEEERG
jgi:hypothetical protein